ncbi:MAG: 30S ribosomal protein S3ae [Euryarchaeota archaeon]|nr:30S ribosomal protein S3ae [Euryarchaeota archaeon]
MASRQSAKARAAARRQKDKWKTKRWYTIRAPRHPWNYKAIGETISETDKQVIGRIYELTQQEFDGDFTKMHVIVRFRVNDVVNSDALTEFIGHHHQNDHTRRQVRRFRGKVDDVVDVITSDGYLLRLKPLIITDRRVRTSVKEAIRSAVRDVIIGFGAKSNFAAMQKAMMGTELEKAIHEAAKSIYPVKSAVIRKSQLLQSGVDMIGGPTLDEIHSDEERSAAEMAARKAAAIAAAAEEEESEDEDSEDAEETPAEEAPAEETPAEEAPAEEAPVEEAPAEEGPAQIAPPDVEYASMKVAELKDLLKAAGKPVSGKKADLVARLLE